MPVCWCSVCKGEFSFTDRTIRRHFADNGVSFFDWFVRCVSAFDQVWEEAKRVPEDEDQMDSSGAEQDAEIASPLGVELLDKTAVAEAASGQPFVSLYPGASITVSTFSLLLLDYQVMYLSYPPGGLIN